MLLGGKVMTISVWVIFVVVVIINYFGGSKILKMLLEIVWL